MNRFRDTTWLGWLLIVLALLGVLAAATTLGAHRKTPRFASNDQIAVPGAARSQAAAAVEDLRTYGQAGLAAGTNRELLHRYAHQVNITAQDAAVTRAEEGAGSDDPLLGTLNYITTVAAALKEQTAAGARFDAVLAASQRTHLNMASTRALNLINGMPVPADFDPNLPEPQPTPRPASPRPSSPASPTAEPSTDPVTIPDLDLTTPTPEGLR